MQPKIESIYFEDLHLDSYLSENYALEGISREIFDHFLEAKPYEVLTNICEINEYSRKLVERLLYLGLIGTSQQKNNILSGILTRPPRVSAFNENLEELLDSEYVSFGAPFDWSFDPPRSAFSGPYLFRKYSLPEKNRFFDQGDIYCLPTQSQNKVGEKILFNSWRNAFCRKTSLMIGGDHSTSYFAVKGITQHSPVIFVQLDAHNDLGIQQFTSYANPAHYIGCNKIFNHANFASRIALNPQIPLLVQAGLRETQFLSEVSPGLLKKKIWQISAEDFSTESLSIVERLKNMEMPVYLSIDLDVIDPSEGVSVTTPLDGGISVDDLMVFLEIIAQCKLNIIGFDIVEFFCSETESGQSKTADTIHHILQNFIGGKID